MSIMAIYITLLLMGIINKGSVACFTNNYTTIIWYHICAVCYVCGLRSSSFESTCVCTYTYWQCLHAVCDDAVDNSSLKSCVPFCKKDTRHKESQIILEPPNYVIIVVNRFWYKNNVNDNRTYDNSGSKHHTLGSRRFDRQANVDHHTPSVYSGHYATSINCCGNTFIVKMTV